MDEEAIVAALQRGSEDAFAELVRAHQARVRVYLGRWLRAADAVDDVAQEVFLAAFRGIAGYDRRVPIALWLLGIARHRVLAHLRALRRQRARLVDRLDDDLLAWRIAQVELDDRHSGAQADRLAALEDCVATLPAHSARLIHDHYVRGERLCDLAARAGRNEGALRMALSRVRAALRDCVRRRLAEAP